MKRNPLRAALLCAFGAACGQLTPAAPAATSPPAETSRPPNIIFILADDLGQGDLGCYNRESKIPTPRMDGLAAAGMRFTDAHTPSSVCTPTRYGILTGRYAWRSRLKSGVLWGYSRALIEPGRTTVASFLRDNGFRTAVVGKWHLGFQSPADDPDVSDDLEQPDEFRVDFARPLRPGPLTAGFDYFFGIPASLDMEPYLYIENDHPLAQPTGTIGKSEHRRKGGAGMWRAGPIAPGFRHVDVFPRLTEKAVDWIRQCAEGGAAGGAPPPFFLYFPLTAPHTPWVPSQEFLATTEIGFYGDFVRQVDDTIGRVLDALEDSGLAGNTLLFLTSDNGSHWPEEDIARWNHRANGPFRGQKADIQEGGHRVPFLARWPGKIPAGAVSDETICLTDLLATCAALLGKELPENAGEDSYNLLPALLGEPLGKPIREATVHHSISGMFSIRQGKWKLVEGRGSGGFTLPKTIKPAEGEPGGELYDLENDIHEDRNLHDHHPEVVSRLTALLNQYRDSTRSVPPP